MKINNEFTVSAPVDKAWEMILDLERVAPCLPGAALTGSSGDGYEGTMKVKIGPITANYKGTVKIEETDEANHRAVVQATGRDARGQGTASATIVSTMQEENGKTRVQVETDMKLTGRAAQFGRGIAQDVAAKVLGRFADCLEQEMLGSDQETAASGASAGAPSDGASASNGAATQETPPVVGGGTGGQVISGASPGLGTTVGGSVISGGGPGAAGAPTTPAGGGAGDGERQARQPEAAQQQAPQPEVEAFDLGEASQGAILKRVGPIAAGAVALIVLILLLRRRKS